MRSIISLFNIHILCLQVVLADRNAIESIFIDSEEELKAFGQTREINVHAQSDPTMTDTDNFESIRVRLQQAQQKHVDMEKEHKEAQQAVKRLKQLQISADPNAKSTCYFEPLAEQWMLGLGLPAKDLNEVRIGQWNMGNGLIVPSIEFISGDWITGFWGDVERKLGRVIIELSGTDPNRNDRDFARYFNQTAQFEREINSILGQLKELKLADFLEGFDQLLHEAETPFHHLYQQCWQTVPLVDVIQMAMETSQSLTRWNPMDFHNCEKIKPSSGNVFRNPDACYSHRKPKFANEGYLDLVNSEAGAFWKLWWQSLTKEGLTWGERAKCRITETESQPPEFITSRGEKFDRQVSPLSDIVPLAVYDYLQVYVTRHELARHVESNETFVPPVFKTMSKVRAEDTLLGIVKEALSQLDVLFLEQVPPNVLADLTRNFHGAGGWHVVSGSGATVVIANPNLLVAEQQIVEKLKESSLEVSFANELGQFDLHYLAKRSARKFQNLKSQFDEVMIPFANPSTEASFYESRPKNFGDLRERWQKLQEEYKMIQQDMQHALHALAPQSSSGVASLVLGNILFVAVHSDSYGNFPFAFLRTIKKVAENIRYSYGCAQLEYVIVGMDSVVQARSKYVNELCNVLERNDAKENMVFDYSTLIKCAAREGWYEAEKQKETKLRFSVEKCRSFAQAQYQKAGKKDRTMRDLIFYHKIKSSLTSTDVAKDFDVPTATIKNSISLHDGQDDSGRFPNEAWPTDHFIVTTNLALNLSGALSQSEAEHF